MSPASRSPRWRAWYPRALRRRGDVWDRLPPELRRVRVARGLMLAYVFAIYLPLQLIGAWERQLAEARVALTTVTLAMIVVLLALRKRAAASVTGRLHVSAADALGILNTPAWKATAWRRSPLSSLLATPATETIVRPASAPATAVSDEVKTHVSGSVR